MAHRRRNTVLRIRTIQDLENAPRLENGAFNLQGADLQDANLEGANLQRANLQRANLQRANLQRANLQRANLEDANLEGANIEGANLQRANLQYVNLEAVNLQGANLQGANLQGALVEAANLQDANLRDANFTEADLRDANLTRATTDGANFQDAILENVINMMTDGVLNLPVPAPIIVIRTIQDLENAPRLTNGAFDLQGADLQGADLQGADLQRAYLTGANLQGADLQGANLQYAILTGANLEGANLEGANLQGAFCSNANLQGANLQGANLQRAALMNLRDANLQGANLQGAQLQHADLQDANFTGADLTGANLNNANLTGANLNGANLTRAATHGAIGLRPIIVIRTIQDLENAPRLRNGAFDLQGADLQGADLQGADLQRADLTGANLQGANLQGANLQDAYFSANVNLQGANLQRVNLQRTTLSYANLRDANLQGANLQRANLQRANLTGANLNGANLNGTNLTRATTDGAIGLRVQQRAAPAPVPAPAPPIPAPPVPAPAPPVPAPPVPAPANPVPAPAPQGLAYEIHNAFNRIDVSKLYHFFRSNIENENQRLRDFNGMNATQFNTYLRDNINHLLNTLSPQELSSLPTMPDGYYPGNIRTWRDVWTTIFETRIRYTPFRQEIQTIICISLLFAQNQGVNFQKNYILSYLNDVAFAYPIRNTDTQVIFSRYFSCTKGIIERFVMSLNVAADTALTDPEVSKEKKTQYRRLKHIFSGGVIDSRILMELVSSWQRDNQNIITEQIGENSEFRTNKDELVEQQKQALIDYLCCQLGLTVEELMSPENVAIQDTINYIFSDDNILDNTLGGRISKTKTRKYKKKLVEKKAKKTKIQKNTKKHKREIKRKMK